MQTYDKIHTFTTVCVKETIERRNRDVIALKYLLELSLRFFYAIHPILTPVCYLIFLFFYSFIL